MVVRRSHLLLSSIFYSLANTIVTSSRTLMTTGNVISFGYFLAMLLGNFINTLKNLCGLGIRSGLGEKKHRRSTLLIR